MIEHLKSLGVTAIEFLPVHFHVDERGLLEKGLQDFWGYNTLSYFSPDPRFCSDPTDPLAAVQEFKTMVRILHQHGFEVILDVVYNHTAEGNHMVTLSTNFSSLEFRVQLWRSKELITRAIIE